MDFLPGLILGTIELMSLDPLPSILSDWTHFQFGLTFRKELQCERASLSCSLSYCVCVLPRSHSSRLTVAAVTPQLQLQLSRPDPEHVNAGPASITLTDCFLSVDKKNYLSASAWVAEQVINTKHFLYCTSSLNVELTPVSVYCQQGAIYPGLIGRARDPLKPGVHHTTLSTNPKLLTDAIAICTHARQLWTFLIPSWRRCTWVCLIRHLHSHIHLLALLRCLVALSE